MNMLGSSGSLLPLKASVFEIVLKDDIPISDYKDGLSRICCWKQGNESTCGCFYFGSTELVLKLQVKLFFINLEVINGDITKVGILIKRNKV
jgi:hypothetical protein